MSHGTLYIWIHVEYNSISRRKHKRVLLEKHEHMDRTSAEEYLREFKRMNPGEHYEALLAFKEWL